MKKKILNLVLALGFTCAGLLVTGTVANAEEYSTGWTVSYDGSQLTSDYNQDTVNSTLKGMMPGDSLTITVPYQNNSTKTTDYYMSSNVISSLEDSTSTSGGAYSYAISYTNGSTTDYIYNSETLGGDSTDVQGLMQAASMNDNYFYIGRLASGESGYVTITVALDGNSQTNAYMNKLAQLGVQFAVEDTASGVRNVVYTIPGGSEIITITDGIVALAGPQTGDSYLPLIICAVALLMGIALIFLYFRLTRENEEKEVA